MRASAYFEKFSPGVLLLYLIIGIIIGSFLGEFIGSMLPEGSVKDALTKSITIGFDTFNADLEIIDFSLGFKFKINILGFAGFIFINYLLRWW